MHQLWPQTDLGSNLDSTSALSLGPSDFTLGYHFLANRMGVAVAPAWWS